MLMVVRLRRVEEDRGLLFFSQSVIQEAEAFKRGAAHGSRLPQVGTYSTPYIP